MLVVATTDEVVELVDELLVVEPATVLEVVEVDDVDVEVDVEVEVDVDVEVDDVELVVVLIDVPGTDVTAGVGETGTSVGNDSGTMRSCRTAESSEKRESRHLPLLRSGANSSARATAVANTARPSAVRCTRSLEITPGVVAILSQSNTVTLS